MVERLTSADAAVIMKLGRNFAKARAAVDQAGMLQRAIYVERGTMEEEIVMPLTEKTEGPAPYFSLILIPGQGRRP
jgi:precorrin-2/cobalt-factor-2 C20-methyltransferase